MAIYYHNVKIVSRSSGRSSVGAAAYRAGEKLTNERDGITHDYTKKQGVIHKEILAPENAPDWARDRSDLWNKVEQSETRLNSQTAREIELALPKELNKDQQIELMRDYLQNNFVNKGMIADYAIHSKEENPHAHVLLTTRKIDFEKNEFEKHKAREWAGDLKSKDLVIEWRESWATTTNRHLERAGIDQKIDHRSYKDQGIDRLSQVKMGAAHQMEKRGIETELGNKNREIAEKNKNLELIDRQEKAYSRQKEIYQERELEERNNPKTDQNQEKERQPELTQNKTEEREKNKPKRHPLTREQWERIKAERETKKQEYELRKKYYEKKRQEVYDSRIERSCGDQRTEWEKRKGIEIDSEENARRSSSKVYDAERDFARYEDNEKQKEKQPELTLEERREKALERQKELFAERERIEKDDRARNTNADSRVRNENHGVRESAKTIPEPTRREDQKDQRIGHDQSARIRELDPQRIVESAEQRVKDVEREARKYLDEIGTKDKSDRGREQDTKEPNRGGNFTIERNRQERDLDRGR